MAFSNILGHGFIKEALVNAAKEGRVSHAYIFSGPEGIGKRLAAIEFAKLLNCESPDYTTDEGGEACPCGACSKIERGIHPDVFLVEHTSGRDIRIDQIRKEVEERVQWSPFEGKTTVAIVDDAHKMNANAQNAFLKTLEEPNAHTVIILLTSQINLLLPTIRSRTQLFEFAPLPEDVVISKLAELTGLSEAEQRVTARLSGGSLGKALMLDGELHDFREKVIKGISSANPNSAADVMGIVEMAPKASGKGDTEKLSFFFDVLSLLIQDMLRIKLGFDEEALANPDLIAFEQRLADKKDLDTVLENRAFLERVRRAVFQQNANRQLALENLVMKIAE